MSPVLILVAFLAGLAIPLVLVGRAFRYLRPQAVIRLIEQQSEAAPPRLITKSRTRLATAEERTQWDQLIRAVREHTGGAVRVGHLAWIAKVMSGTTAPEPVPDLEPRIRHKD